MSKVTITVERVDDLGPGEVLELAGIDAVGRAALDGVPDDALSARIVRRGLCDDTGATNSAAMVVAAGDLRVPGAAAALIGAKRADALGVAVVAVGATGMTLLREVERAFDAVLPVGVVEDEDVTTRLSKAVSAVTCFATANQVAIPLDEAYGMFCRGGRLVCAVFIGADVAVLARTALRSLLRQAEQTRGGRLLAHVVSTPDEYAVDLRCVADVLHERPLFEEVYLALSLDKGPIRSVTLLLSAPVGERKRRSR